MARFRSSLSTRISPFLRSAAPRCALHAVLLLAASGCTIGNEGEVDRDPPPARLNESTPEAMALWNNPTDNPLADYLALLDSETEVLPRGNFALGNYSVEVGAYYTAFRDYLPFGNSLEQEQEQCVEAAPLPPARGVFCAAIEPATAEEREAEQEVLDRENRQRMEANVAREQMGQEPLGLLEPSPDIQFAFIADMPHNIQYRTIGLEVLQCARDAGFEYLAVEALAETTEALAQRGYVSKTESGPFMREPRLARMVNDALALGFKVVGFPVENQCTVNCDYEGIARDNAAAQAQSLLAQTYELDPEAKVLVWSMPRQAYKREWGPAGGGRTALAGQVFDATGLEPYTLDQIRVGRGLAYGDTSEIQIATGPQGGSCAGSYQPDTPIANVNVSLYDGLLIHSLQPADNAARWPWVYAPAEERMQVQVDCQGAGCLAEEPILVQAFPAGVAVDDRVPADQAMCSPGQACQLILPEGEYQLRVWSPTAQLGAIELAEFVPGTVTSVSVP